ncbi:hypothetical protein [Jeotgalicoccus coquinae]|uniref:Uncharacterized protein n=1 Tax=Jeotgalicoccus coquinae TaxID=709509 RepID=A0A6V7R9J6_9STAP|nr:hypothetical protein [Jeotgalicoccus coquinae]MBB6423042.1 hypothetical protein [Jeotgalicoccus coquinae]CAD2073492.1 hypothetical protein JEOCOQ751_00641 [Jeotgalicoccus coquinae]
MMNLSDKEKQIKVLLGGRGRAYDYACQTLGVDNMMHHSYADVFTVSEADVYDYILKNGLPESEDTSKESLKEGFHYYKEDGRWHTFFRERNYIFDEKSFEDDTEARKYIAGRLIRLSGTGLY